MITEDIKGGMEGVIPSMMVTSSPEGIPNIAYVSQVYYVDPTHVAISHQFFNKSIRNIRENPFASVNLVRHTDLKAWRMDLRHSHSETAGELYDSMSAQLEAIASMMGMEHVFHLQCAEVFEVLDIQVIE